MLERYRNKSGKSGVRRYEIGEEAITIEFAGGELYLYTYRSAGKARVEKMKKLALKGEGLSTYVSREVKDKFERIVG